VGYQGTCLQFSDIQQSKALPANMTDAELNHLFASCMPRLKNTSRQLLRNCQDSEDAVQEGLLLAFKNLNQFEGRSKFSTWLHSIVTNAARTHVRKTKCRPQFSWEEFCDQGELTVERVTVDPRPGPDERCERSERSRILLHALQELPGRYQAVIRLCDVDGVDAKDAAQKLGITPATLKILLFRARGQVTRRIRDRYVATCEQSPRESIARIDRKAVLQLGEKVRSVGGLRQSGNGRRRIRAKANKKNRLQAANRKSRRREIF
jgi:RNA polymerase sigma-70 factor, ECF subfamily